MVYYPQKGAAVLREANESERGWPAAKEKMVETGGGKATYSPPGL